MLTLMR